MKLKTITLSILLASSLFAGKNTMITESKVIEIVEDTSAFYIGVGASYFNLKDSTTEESFTSLGAMLQVGYKYNNYIGIEARYTQSVGDVAYDKGNTLATNISNYPTTASNIAIYLKPQYPLGDFSLYGLLGYGMVQYTDLPTGTKDRQESSFQWGLGAEYLVMDNISIFADYSRLYDGTGFDGHVPNSNVYSDVVTVGVSYRF
ncbi:MAG: porin family protein [Sulfurovum sp.]